MPNKASFQLFAWVAIGFGLLLTAWAALFVVASHSHVAEVPLATDKK